MIAHAKGVSLNSPLGDYVSEVQLLDHMGSDLTVVNAARVSMAKESDWDVVTVEDADKEAEFTFKYPEWRLSDKDSKLITYLAKHGHWTPFSQPQIQLRLCMPIYVARQWFKHQVGFTRNETSRRYVDEPPELHLPQTWRHRATNVKQGSSDVLVDMRANLGMLDTPLAGATLQDAFELVMSDTLELYRLMVQQGVAPEQARMVLPQSMYTEFVETGSLAAYARLCKLRLDQHAQFEIRQYAEAVSDLIASLFPASWAALMGVPVSVCGAAGRDKECCGV